MVDKTVFTVGRGPSCDLVIANQKLSREHLRIERSGERFVVADAGSSNGTDLNSRPLFEPTEVISGDRADLGGGCEIEFEFVWEERSASEELVPTTRAAVAEASLTADAPPVTTSGTRGPEAAGGFPLWLLIVGPVSAIFLLVIGLGLVLLLGGGGNSQRADASDRNTRISRVSDDDGDDDDDKPVSDKTPRTDDTVTATGTPGSNTTQPSPANLSETAKIEQSAAAFLRRIAQNDPKAFLTSDQAKVVNSKIKSLSGSSTLAANIESARKASSQIKTLAESKNLPPQFLATAALAKLGNTRGDVLQTAQSMAGILERLNTQIGSELSDDSLLMIAAFDQGERGDFMRLRNMLQDLATKFPESARAIRSIWFLQKQNKITDAEFDLAVRFLAIGTITQNPKDFGISAEPLVL